jgi:excisionase family DNA binding protein
MEKISIVKRRKRGQAERDKLQSIGSEIQTFPCQELTEIPARLLKENQDVQNVDGVSQEEKPSDPTTSIQLTPEQYNLVKSSQFVHYFLDGESSGVSLDKVQHANGQVVFHFQFKRVDTVKMLKTQHVCQMLQISESLLMRLVKDKKIRSYKVGRLRRFLLEDILDYLSKSEDIVIHSNG